MLINTDSRWSYYQCPKESRDTRQESPILGGRSNEERFMACFLVTLVGRFLTSVKLESKICCVRKKTWHLEWLDRLFRTFLQNPILQKRINFSMTFRTLWLQINSKYYLFKCSYGVSDSDWMINQSDKIKEYRMHINADTEYNYLNT